MDESDRPRKENIDVPVAAVGWTSQMDREKRTLMDLERRIQMSQLRSSDGQARDGPRKENTDVPVAAVGGTSQMDRVIKNTDGPRKENTDGP